MTSDDAAPRTLCEAFGRVAALSPDAVALRTPGDTTVLTWADYRRRVDRIAAVLHDLGVRPGDTVAMMLVNRPEFHLVDTAALHLGATPFSIYNSNSPEQIEYLFTNAGNKVVVTEPQFVARLHAAGAAGVVSVEDCPDALSLAALEASAPAIDVAALAEAVEPDDVATLIYTSGTTGPPKGVECTHRQLLAATEGFAAWFPVGPEDSGVSFLPSAHIGDRIANQYLQLRYGLTITSVADPRALGAGLLDAAPTVFVSTPSAWQRMRSAVLPTLGGTPAAALPAGTKAAIRTTLGLQNIRWAACGGGPVPPEVMVFLNDLGVPVVQVWGMSETSGIGTTNPATDNRPGTVGRAIPGAEATLAPDGELLFRGTQVMRGYRHQPEATAAAVDADGWLHTGDVATIDDDGYVTIVDRKKEIIINAAGKNMSPVNIETIMKAAAPLLFQAVAIGDARDYVAALFVLDPDAASAWALAQGVDGLTPAELAAHPALLDALEQGVRAGNQRLSRVEQIKRFRVLPEVWIPGGVELTPTMKLRRRPIAERYAAEIEELYLSEPPATVRSIMAVGA
jgi:long-subunit acyl-CoA synthetase (AMP-forming)